MHWAVEILSWLGFVIINPELGGLDPDLAETNPELDAVSPGLGGLTREVHTMIIAIGNTNHELNPERGGMNH